MSTVYFNLSGGSLVQDWSNTGLIGTSDNWDSVPSIVGFRGDALTGTTGTDARTITGTSTVVDVNANQTTPNGFTTGGVTEFELANPTVALAGSGTARAPYLALYLDASGRKDVTVSFTARDLETGADNAAQQVAVQYRIGDSGPWIDLPAGYIADATVGGAAGPNIPVTVTLPAAVNGQGQVQVRIITTDAAGNDEWVGIDDILVTSQPAAVVPNFPGQLSIGDATVVEGDSGSTAITFTVTRANGSDGAVGASWSLVNGATNAADFTGATSGTVSFAAGETSKTITLLVAGDTVSSPTRPFQSSSAAPRAAPRSATPAARARSLMTIQRRRLPMFGSMKSITIPTAPTPANISRSRALPGSTSPAGAWCSTTATAARLIRRSHYRAR